MPSFASQLELLLLRAGMVIFPVAGGGFLVYSFFRYQLPLVQMGNARKFESIEELRKKAIEDSKDDDSTGIYAYLEGIVGTNGKPLVAPVSIEHIFHLKERFGKFLDKAICHPAKDQQAVIRFHTHHYHLQYNLVLSTRLYWR
jgi:hypothetical protein